jgi:hypothetical protein
VKKEEGPRAQKILRAESVQKPTGEKVAFSAEAHRRSLTVRPTVSDRAQQLLFTTGCAADGFIMDYSLYGRFT